MTQFGTKVNRTWEAPFRIVSKMWSKTSSVGIVQLNVTKWELRYGLTCLDVHQNGKGSRLLNTVETALFDHAGKNSFVHCNQKH